MTEHDEQPREPLWRQRAAEGEAAQREAAFQEWWDTRGQHYEAAVIANDGTPWTTSIEERRELFMRRYDRPEPPEGLFTDPRQAETRVAGSARPRAGGPEGIESGLRPSLNHAESRSPFSPIDDTEDIAA